MQVPLRFIVISVAILVSMNKPGACQSQTFNGEELYLEAVKAFDKKDNITAQEKLKASANLGFAKAQLSLGKMHFAQNEYELAFTWTNKAALQGNAKAMTLLGHLYSMGYGIHRDDSLALKWTLEAAEAGDPEAQVCMAARYADGKGVPKDYIQTHKWLQLAWDRLPANNKPVAGMAIRILKGTIHLMTDEQRRQARQLAEEWREK
ncbi:hypothetical protein [Terasakiella sp.]|uniref:hypothetical protein n=1 Tax=Terasakiella sp. TaxID=2034861 RepID=UPI003AA93F09